MRFSFLLLALASVLFFEAAAGGAQFYELTNVSGEIQGYAYLTTYPNGVAHTSGGSYSQQLDPSNNYSISASVSPSGTSSASLSAAAFESAIIFTATAFAQTSSFTDSASQPTRADVILSIGFTVNEAILLQLTYDFVRNLGSQSSYAFQNNYDAAMNASLVQILDGGGSSSLYTLTANNYALATSQGLDTYGADDGVYFQAALLPGNYQFSLTGYAVQGDSMANGSLNFSPVPEPGGMLLVVLGMAVLGRRRRC